MTVKAAPELVLTWLLHLQRLIERWRLTPVGTSDPFLVLIGGTSPCDRSYIDLSKTNRLEYADSLLSTLCRYSLSRYGLPSRRSGIC